MTKQEQKALAIVGGVCLIGGAYTAYKKSKKWEEAHSFFTFIGALATIIGIFA